MHTKHQPTDAYLQLVEHTLHNGQLVDDQRTGKQTLSVFDQRLVFDMRKDFPLLLVRAVPYDKVWAELRGFLNGVSSAADFRAFGTKIWDANANQNEAWLANLNRKGEDDLGRSYGSQWRDWASADGCFYDQIRNLIEDLKNDPHSRRHLVSAWNPGELDQTALAPCHFAFQCYVRKNLNGLHYLDMKMHQRSADLYLGVPFNMASYATLLHLLAAATGMQPGTLTMDLGDTHLYVDHLNQARELILRGIAPDQPLGAPRLSVKYGDEMRMNYKDEHALVPAYAAVRDLPQVLRGIAHRQQLRDHQFLRNQTVWGNLLDLPIEAVQIENYRPMPALTAPMAV